MRPWAWRTLGHIQKVHQSGGLGRDIWKEGGRMDTDDGGASDDDDSSVEVLQSLGNDAVQDKRTEPQREGYQQEAYPQLERTE